MNNCGKVWVAEATFDDNGKSRLMATAMQKLFLPQMTVLNSIDSLWQIEMLKNERSEREFCWVTWILRKVVKKSWIVDKIKINQFSFQLSVRYFKRDKFYFNLILFWVKAQSSVCLPLMSQLESHFSTFSFKQLFKTSEKTEIEIESVNISCNLSRNAKKRTESKKKIGFDVCQLLRLHGNWKSSFSEKTELSKTWRISFKVRTKNIYFLTLQHKFG